MPVLAILVVNMAIPAQITVSRGQSLDFNWGITAKACTENEGNFPCQVKLFNLIPIKTVNVSVMPSCYVIPSGEAIGIRLYSDGLLVVGISDVVAADGKHFAPAKDSGLKEGDRIMEVNGEKVESTVDFTKKMNACRGKAELTVARGDNFVTADVTAVYSGDDGGYKVGMWVRDSTAGIGTMTFYNPENGCFASLGHGICDSDTKDLITVARGWVSSCRIVGVEKGKSGQPGELIGDFSNKKLGDIETNCHIGVYGESLSAPEAEPVPIATRFEIKEGGAEILCDIDGSGPTAYEVEITKISKSPKVSNKNFVLKVTDTKLLEKTGGIVQGMSGSPVIQNGKLIGAVTHVFVNDPTRGYGIFIENMLSEAEKIK